MLCGHMKRVSQSANMCRQNRKSEGGAGRQDTADWLTLPQDAKVHQAVKCRKSKQAFNETKAQQPRPVSPCLTRCQVAATARTGWTRGAREQGAACLQWSERRCEERTQRVN